MRYPMPSAASGTALRIAARTCSSFGLTTSGWAAMYSSTDLGTLYFMPLILCSACGFSSPSGFPYVRRALRHGQPRSSSSTVEYSDVCEPNLDKKSPYTANLCPFLSSAISGTRRCQWLPCRMADLRTQGVLQVAAAIGLHWAVPQRSKTVSIKKECCCAVDRQILTHSIGRL